jgi:DNA-binding transcriptional LysR family regulator
MNADRWSELELIGEILRGKTLSAAARTLGVDQTTVARRLSAFERRLGARLFDRIEGRLVPTPELAGLSGRLRAISEEAADTLAILKRTTAELRGQVRITSVGFVLARILAPALGVFSARHPGIALDLLADDQSLSFARREADIAIRFGGNAEETTRIKHLGMMQFRLFRPKGLTEAGELPVVRYGEELDHLPEMRALDAARKGTRIALRSSRTDVLIEAALVLGAEIMLPELIGRADRRFETVVIDDGRAERPLYLLIHPDRARTPTVARTATWVEETVRRWNSAG